MADPTTLAARLRESSPYSDDGTMNSNMHLIREAADTIEALQAIVDRLPKTKDGVPLLPGDTAYWLCRWGKREGQVLEMMMDSFCDTEEYSLSYGWEYTINFQNAGVWSTREAAEKSRSATDPADAARNTKEA